MSYIHAVRGAIGGPPGIIGALPASIVSSTPANASLTLNNDGTFTRTPGASGNWLVPGGLASRWEVRATVLSGSLSGGTTGSWLALSSNHTWTRNTVGAAEVQFEFRSAASGIVHSTQTVDIEES